MVHKFRVKSIVTTTRNSIVKKTGVNNANLITLTFTESGNGSTTTKHTNKWNLPTLVNVAKLNAHCINVHSLKNKAISVSGFVISRDIDILALTVKPIPMRDNYTNFEHSNYYVNIRAVTFRLCVMYRPPPSKRNGFSNTFFFVQ